MCLGIPGQLVEFMDEHEHLAKVDVAGVRRTINIGLLEDEGLVLGDWVLIHVGFAMSKIDEAEAQMAMEGLQLMGQAYDEEVAALLASRIAEVARPAVDEVVDTAVPAFAGEDTA
jgi:hydrogenase expression/formation protein HypC